MIVGQVNLACPKVKRQARYQAELSGEVIDTIFASTSPGELTANMAVRVFNNEKFDRLPKYRQVAMEAYAQGALDAMARLAGSHAAHARPSTPPPTAKIPRPRRPRMASQKPSAPPPSALWLELERILPRPFRNQEEAAHGL